MVMTKRYKSAWWSVELPDTWKANKEEDCVTFTSENDVGALQISAYRREDKEVNNDELLHFAEDELVEGVELQDISCGEFTGLGISYLVDSNYWRKWWLWKGSLLLYVTYTCSAEKRFVEEEAVNQIMSSLKTEPL
jgi:hypothetical protein